MGWMRRLFGFDDKPVLEAPIVEEEQTVGQGIRVGTASPPIGALDKYRRMRSNPTIALARAIATQPAKSADWEFSSDADCPDEVFSFIRDVMEPLREKLVTDMTYAVDYGCKPFEKVWARDDQNRLIYDKIKPLSLDQTELIITDVGFGGIKQGAVTLEPVYCFWYTFDREDDDLWGRSRHKNVEKPWEAWEKALKKQDQFIGLASNPVPMVEYPLGYSKDSWGRKKSNFELAQALIKGLSDGTGIAMPNVLAKSASELLSRNVDIAKLKAWTITFLQASGNVGDGFINILRHLESLMLRGWLVPERTATEGQYGTKAEAETHANIAIQMTQDMINQMVVHINRYLIDPLLVLNYGEEMRGKVWISVKPLQDETSAALGRLVEKVISTPETFERWLDVDSVFDRLGWPKTEQSLEMPATDPAQIEAEAAALIQALSRTYSEESARILGRVA